MGNLFQEVFLSNVMIFLVMGFIMLLVTGWAFSLREYAGYILGWLTGVFLIIVLSTLIQPVPTSEFEAFDVASVEIDFLSLMIPSALGLVVGFGLLMLIRSGGYSDSRVRRAITMAITVTIVLVSWYLMLQTYAGTRVLIAVFLLTFAIGGMLSFILTRGFSFNRRPYLPPEEADPLNSLEMGDDIVPVSHVSPLGQRVRDLRDRMQRRTDYPQRDYQDDEYREIP